MAPCVLECVAARACKRGGQVSNACACDAQSRRSAQARASLRTGLATTARSCCSPATSIINSAVRSFAAMGTAAQARDGQSSTPLYDGAIHGRPHCEAPAQMCTAEITVPCVNSGGATCSLQTPAAAASSGVRNSVRAHACAFRVFRAAACPNPRANHHCAALALANRSTARLPQGAPPHNSKHPRRHGGRRRQPRRLTQQWPRGVG